MRRSFQCLALMFLALLVGCGGCGKEKTARQTKNGNKPSEENPPVENLPPLSGEPTVAVWNWDQTLDAVHQHQGEVVVLHLWASWHETKDYYFDEFVRLKKLFRNDVAAIALNTDYTGQNPPESYTDMVMEFAKKHGANFQNGISSVPDELLQEKLDILGMPAVLVFDKSGKKRKTFFQAEGAEPFSYRKDVIPFVETLIKEPYTPPAKPQQPEEIHNPAKNPKLEQEAGKAKNPQPEDDKQNAGTAQSSEAVRVQVRDWDGLQKLVADEQGKVVVVDLWSTSCLPCMKEFPNLVKLHNKHKTDVACVSFNLDYVGLDKIEDLKPAVLEFLKRQKATFPNILSSEKDEDIYAKLDLASIPAVYVYDRKGKLRKRFDQDAGEFTYEKDIVPLVEKLIEKK